MARTITPPPIQQYDRNTTQSRAQTGSVLRTLPAILAVSQFEGNTAAILKSRSQERRRFLAPVPWFGQIQREGRPGETHSAKPWPREPTILPDTVEEVWFEVIAAVRIGGCD
jgi:hypothetical protein